MQVTYDGAHSVLIGDFVNGSYDRSGFISTWEDWHLIPVSRPVINPPDVRTDVIDVPGTNGSIDLTTALLGYPTYTNRSGSLEFYVDHNQWNWDMAYDNIMNAIHGFTKKVILTDVPSFYYEGRLSVNQFKSDKLASQITIDYDLDPFKRMIWSTLEDWLWDPFDFKEGLIVDKERFSFELSGNSTTPTPVPASNKFNSDLVGYMPIIPTIRVKTNGKIDWTNTPSGMAGSKLVCNQYSQSTFIKTTELYFTQSTEVTNTQDPSNSYLVLTDPTFVIGRPIPSYEMSIQFWNKFKDSNDNYISATFSLDYRPGRL